VKDRPYINDVAHPTAAPSSSGKGEGFKSEGEYYDNGSKYDNGAKPDSEPNSSDVHIPAEKPEGESFPLPKPNENNGFHSSVKPTSASGAEESAHPGKYTIVSLIQWQANVTQKLEVNTLSLYLQLQAENSELPLWVWLSLCFYFPFKSFYNKPFNYPFLGFMYLS
jgi:hypothetical protein